MLWFWLPFDPLGIEGSTAHGVTRRKSKPLAVTFLLQILLFPCTLPGRAAADTRRRVYDTKKVLRKKCCSVCTRDFINATEARACDMLY